MLNEGWALICEAGFWGWVLASVGLILHVFPRLGEFNRRPALLWGGVFLLSYALWIMGMLNA